jgi:Nif-specific regulatory protein
MEIKCRKAGDECYGLREMILLFDISQQLIQTRQLKNDLPAILRMIVEYLDAERSFLSIFNRENSKIYIEAAYGLSLAQQARGKYDLGEGITGKVVEMVRPVVIEKISKSGLFLNKTNQEVYKNGKELTIICVPIVENAKAIGTLSVVRVFNPHITFDEDIRLLTIIGSLIGQVVRSRQERMEELELLKQKNLELETKLSGTKNLHMIGNSSKMRDVFSLVQMVGKTNSTVLIRGESGVGKELVAEAIKLASNRNDKPFIKVNCSALPESLIESELFGHEKGAFTGAETQRKGRFELADKGTIFLDEIGDIPLSAQVKILRIIQQLQFERLGGTQTINVDVRIVAATNRNLEEMIKNGEFREDLYTG